MNRLYRAFPSSDAKKKGELLVEALPREKLLSEQFPS
jgi:hypothetical protein